MLDHMTDFRTGTLAPGFEAMETIMATFDSVLKRNEGKAALDLRRWATRAALGLMGKARKSADAVYLNARYGYGEDAMIVSRSLVNLCIDLRFICGELDESETRARRWIARGRVGRRDFAKRVGTEPPDESRVDWAKEKALSEEWNATSIYRRAELSGLLNFYNLPYRHGSVFEHSDSWSALSFLNLTETEIVVTPGPSARFVDLALISGGCSLAQVAVDFGKYYGFDMGDAPQVMDSAIRKGFPQDVESLQRHGQ